jgi:hypothetical protein
LFRKVLRFSGADLGCCPCRQLAALGGGSGLGITAHRLEEEVASTRYILLSLLSLAMQAGEWADYIHLVEVYSRGQRF